MKEFEEQMKLLDAEVNKYYKGKGKLSGHELIEIASRMVSLLYFLTSVRAEVHDAYQSLIYDLTKDKNMSVSRADNEAHVTYPSMYTLRHKLTAAWEVVGMIRTNISYIKLEMNNRID